MSETEPQIEMFVAGLVLDPSTNAPIVVLKDASGETCLPIWIGMPEASAIASALKKLTVARPMTHDLLQTLIEEFGGSIAAVLISELRENTFIAQLVIEHGDSRKTLIDSRPSDALALAVRTGAQIFVLESVLEKAKVTLVEIDTDDTESFELSEEEGEGSDQDFTSLDKEKWEQILAEMDPDDFKYKM